MDELTRLWALTTPGTAAAAGVDLDPEEALDLSATRAAARSAAHSRMSVLEEEGRETAHRALTGPEAPPAPPDWERLLLRAILAQSGPPQPYAVLREHLEWVRALVYLGRCASPLAARSDAAMARLLRAGRWSQGSLIERLLARDLLDAIALLADRAGLPATRDAVPREGFGDLPPNPGFAWVAARADFGPLVDRATHQSLLRDAYGFDEAPEQLDRVADTALAEHVDGLWSSARRVGPGLAGKPARAGEVASALERERSPGGSATQVARAMAGVSRDLVDTELVALGPQERAVVPEPTPAAMRPLTTEGEEYLAGALTGAPVAHCFVTEVEPGSVYSLANIVLHELAHCWNMLRASREATDLPGPFRVSWTLGAALLEGIATSREWEVYELHARAVRAGPRASPAEEAFAGLFDGTGLPRAAQVEEFEFDTRYWRVARLVRALFDLRVQGGQQPYAEFIPEMADRTGLTVDHLHGFCWHFFEKPGYPPCYALGAMKLEALRAEARSLGEGTRAFNTRVDGAGLIPPATWTARLRRP